MKSAIQGNHAETVPSADSGCESADAVTVGHSSRDDRGDRRVPVRFARASDSDILLVADLDAAFDAVLITKAGPLLFLGLTAGAFRSLNAIRFT